MPHRIASVLAHLAPILGWVGGLSASVGVITGDGLAAAITVIGLAFCVTLGRMTPTIAGAIREWGYAYADVRKRLQVTDDKANSAIIKSDQNRTVIEEVRARAAAEIAEVKRTAAAEIAEARTKAEAVEAEANRKSQATREEALRAAKAIRDEATQKRHDLNDRLSGQLLLAQARIAELESRVGTTDSSHALAINLLADDVQVIAGQMDPPIPVSTPHLDSTTPADPGANR